MVLVNFGGKNLFWSNLAKKKGFGQVKLQVKLGLDKEKLVLVDLSRKKSFKLI